MFWTKFKGHSTQPPSHPPSSGPFAAGFVVNLSAAALHPPRDFVVSATSRAVLPVVAVAGGRGRKGNWVPQANAPGRRQSADVGGEGDGPRRGEEGRRRWLAPNLDFPGKIGDAERDLRIKNQKISWNGRKINSWPVAGISAAVVVVGGGFAAFAVGSLLQQLLMNGWAGTWVFHALNPKTTGSLEGKNAVQPGNFGLPILSKTWMIIFRCDIRWSNFTWSFR